MAATFYPDDIVYNNVTKMVGVVERTHGDPDTHEPFPAQHEPNPITRESLVPADGFRKFLKTGIVPSGTVFLHYTKQAVPAVVSESHLTLVERSFLIGDVVKKGVNDAMSGVVINCDTTCRLQAVGKVKYKSRYEFQALVSPEWQLIPGLKVDEPTYIADVPNSELQAVESPTEEDVVLYKDWIGRVTSVTYKITLRLADNCVVEIQDEEASHADGMEDVFEVGDIAVTKKGHLRHGKWIFGQYNANTPPVGTVVQNRPVAIGVIWLQKRISSLDEIEPPAVLERDDFESSHFHVYDFTKRPTVKSTSRTVSYPDTEVQLASRVRFKDLSGARMKYGDRLPKIDRADTLGYDLNVFDIASFQSKLTVQWQDLTISEHQSTELVPDTSIEDEHAAWPGEIAHTLDAQPVPGLPNVEQPSRVGVIQAVNAEERMARIKWCPDAAVQYAVDPDDESGSKSMVRGTVGQASGDDELVSLYDVEAPPMLNVRRGDLVLIANNTWANEPLTRESRQWLGEIVDAELDGMLIVRLGAAQTVQDVRLRREDVIVTIRSDGTNHVDEIDEMAEEEEDLDEAFAAIDGFDPDMLDGADEAGFWRNHGRDEYRDDGSDDDGDSWASSDEDKFATYQDESGRPLDEEDVVNGDWEPEDDDEDTEMKDAPQQDTPATTPSLSPAHATVPSKSAITPSEPPEGPAPQYTILDTPVTPSHHFFNQPTTEDPAYMKRVQKEHKVLRTPGNLPPGVYVRTWESRMDLLRILIVGPSETPYQNAPFILDMYLPSDFPHNPPQAHFYSWIGESGLGGVGRVNPNLYEDGKICLSILGTWEGSKGEGWSASRSTLLQVLVSLLGLVLVKEPYFNEAGYEPLAGLESSKRPSTLYSERAYLRSRAFVLTALGKLRKGEGKELQGLEDALRWCYYEVKGPKLLEWVIGDVEGVLADSQREGKEPDGLSVMSKGACIPLQRVLERLKGLR